MFEFVVYMGMIERISSSLSKYYVYIHCACTVSMSLQK